VLVGSLGEDLLGDGKGGGFPDFPEFPPAPRCWSPSAVKGLVHLQDVPLCNLVADEIGSSALGRRKPKAAGKAENSVINLTDDGSCSSAWIFLTILDPRSQK